MLEGDFLNKLCHWGKREKKGGCRVGGETADNNIHSRLNKWEWSERWVNKAKVQFEENQHKQSSFNARWIYPPVIGGDTCEFSRCDSDFPMITRVDHSPTPTTRHQFFLRGSPLSPLPYFFPQSPFRATWSQSIVLKNAHTRSSLQWVLPRRL